MNQTRLTFHTAYAIGQVDPRLFGGFLEHMGRAVYEGIYDPHSQHADENGFRTDVLAALKRLNMPIIRYPGGNFASGYHWQDGIGPREQRPAMRDLAWQSIEPNAFGTDEFIRLCRQMGWQPVLTVNLGTGTPEEARNWVEYCNAPAGTKYANLRVANGSPAPYGVPLWCLGNEMDGPWQLGHGPAEHYAIRAQQAAKMMKDLDSSIALVLGGSCGIGMPTYMEWDRQVLDYVGDLADYISLHRYVGNPENDTLNYLAVTNSIDQQIEDMDAACRFIQAKRRSKKRAFLSFDEWNVWYRKTTSADMDGKGKFAPHLIEEVYNLEDALVVAGFFNSFIRHANVLKIANLAQIANVIAPILTRGDDMLIQSIFYPFEMYTRRREGISLWPVVEGPSYEGAANGRAHFIDTSAIWHGAQCHVFVTNRSLDDAAVVRVHVADRTIKAVGNAEILTGSDPQAANSFEHPDRIGVQPFTGIQIKEGQAVLELPPLAVAAITFSLE